MTLTTAAKDYIASNLGRNNCFASSGVSYTDPNGVGGAGSTYNVVQTMKLGGKGPHGEWWDDIPDYRQIGNADITWIGNNPWNWKPGNIHLVCRKHNLELRKLITKEHKAKMARYCAKNEKERKKTKGDVPGDLVMAMVDYTSGSPEMQVNIRCKQLFADWLIELLNKHGQWPKKDIINLSRLMALV